MSGVSGGNVKNKISRLQELLERVQMRASTRDRAPGHGAAEVVQAAPVAQTSPPPAAYDERDGEISVAPATPAQVASFHPPAPPSFHPSAHPSAPPMEQDYDMSSDSEVEVSSEVVEVDIDIEEGMPLESGAQPVAQQTMPPEDLLDEAQELEPMATQPSEHPAHHAHHEEEVARAAPPANEIEEPAPSSSRRPIAAEEVAAGAYEEESSPRHTPPPESGKQVAAPSAHPPSRKPSAPPPSLEGHTLIGGWREPGLGAPHISPSAGVSAGVRVPAPGPGGTEPPATVVQGTVVAQASGTRLTADVTRPELASSANVAAFSGAPAVERPKTLGELLDLTLGL